MAFDVSGAIASVGGRDFSRTNLFEVEIDGLDGFKFRAKSTTLPEGTVGMVEVPYFNRKLKIAGDRTFGDWTVTVMEDDRLTVRKQIEAWQALCQTMGGESAGLSPNLYYRDAVVKRFNRNGEVTAVYKLTQIWPMTIAQVNHAWESNDEIEAFDITFAINWSDPVQ